MFRSMMAMMQPGGLSAMSSSPGASTPAANSSSTSTAGAPAQSSSAPAGPAPIGPYQSARLPLAPQGFPSSSVNISANGTSAAPVPFLGFNQLGGMSHASHVNQQRLASAQATLPRAPSLQARRARSSRPRGPAIHPPSLPVARKPSVANSCMTEVFHPDGSAVPAARVTVKVYPPQVCDILMDVTTCSSHNAC